MYTRMDRANDCLFVACPAVRSALRRALYTEHVNWRCQTDIRAYAHLKYIYMAPRKQHVPRTKRRGRNFDWDYCHGDIHSVSENGTPAMTDMFK